MEVAAFADYFLNGVQGVDLPATIGNDQYIVSYHRHMAGDNVIDPNRHQFVVQHNNESTERIEINTFKDFVSLKVINATEANFHSSIGLMGRFQDGVGVDRSGAKTWQEESNHNAFGQEWQVRDTDPQLFQSNRVPQYPQSCILPKQKSVISRLRRRLGENTVPKDKARAACQHWKDSRQVEMCIFDVLASGDLDMAGASSLIG